MMLFILLALALLCHVSGKAINTFAGPYKVVPERFYMCEPDNRVLPARWYLRISHFNPHKPKELQLLTGNITVQSVSMDNSAWVKGNIDVRSNNQWKKNAFVGSFNNSACRALKENIPGFYDVFFKKKEIGGVCSIKPGVYEVNDAPVDWNFPKAPIFPYGQYRFRLLFGKAEKMYSCFVVENTVIPKP
ncbi:uncharacterized protein LOC113202630 [Frankliniella occidentalis]|uniref:Uncharacterized protein LOC113202630 n=1 Tax=Frankliniella occidentalis TaxID=133901 RepID=A0A9C6TU73_FRAOC|nr:uncharacterized protein LOC113202630 [Frankliniella occidentalis]XP_052122400.1 uncharacterized protein LOC113202630 [Frankliniella occidentalis]